MLLDTERKLYCAVGLGRSVSKVWNIQTLIYYAEQKAAGLTLPQKFENVEDDPHQMGGDFIVGNDGNMALVHCSTSPTDRPSVDEIITVLKGLRKRNRFEFETIDESSPRKRTRPDEMNNFL